MKIGLFDVDSEIPNLALMKVSRYHKDKGDQVILMKGKDTSTRLIQFDQVYISCIFEENRDHAIMLSKTFSNSLLGGVGVNNNKLPSEIDSCSPDYDLYKSDYSLGFTTRGCVRNCDFCKVRDHEGNIKIVGDLYSIWNKDHKHIVLMDNNILALKKHFMKIADQIIKEGLSVDFNQGLDIRYLDDDVAKKIKELRIKPTLRFAFDSLEIEKDVLRGIRILNRNGIKRALWYVIVGFDTTIQDDLDRFNLLKEHGQRAYCMRHSQVRGIKEYNDLSAWVNQQGFFMKMDFESFVKKRKRKVFI